MNTLLGRRWRVAGVFPVNLTHLVAPGYIYPDAEGEGRTYTMRDAALELDLTVRDFAWLVALLNIAPAQAFDQDSPRQYGSHTIELLRSFLSGCRQEGGAAMIGRAFAGSGPALAAPPAADTQPPAAPADPHMDVDELARYLRRSPHTIRNMHKAGRLPAPLPLGRRLVWLRTDIDGMLAQAREKQERGRRTVRVRLSRGALPRRETS